MSDATKQSRLTLQAKRDPRPPMHAHTTAYSSKMITPSVKRVVSCFILRRIVGSCSQEHHQTRNNRDSNVRVAVFHRVATMPTFPSHWAPCSGSIEEGEIPLVTARRELMEETNLSCSELLLAESQEPRSQHGLYVDVPFPSRDKSQPSRNIRVYPFTVEIPDVGFELELRGTEHDTYQWFTVDQLEQLQPAVPGLAQAFHHATAGRYLASVTQQEREWANDHVNVELVRSHQADPARMIMLRPSMVAIVNALNPIIQKQQKPQEVRASLQQEADRAIDHAVEYIHGLA